MKPLTMGVFVSALNHCCCSSTKLDIVFPLLKQNSTNSQNSYAGRSLNKIWTSGRYSIEVSNSDDVQRYIELDNGESDSAGVTTLGDVQGSNTITATASTTITAYEDLQQYVFRSILINTDAVTLNIDSVGAKSIVKNNNEAIQPGNFEATQNIVVTYNLTDDVFEWSNQNLIANSSYKGTDIASASSITIPTDGSYFVLTGSVTVATINVAIDREFTLECSGGLTFTDGSSIISEDSVDVVVAAGGVVMFQSTSDNISQVTKTPAVLPPDTGWVFVSSVTASSSATVSFTGFEANFDYMVEMTAVLPATDIQIFEAELGISGPTYRTSGYHGLAGGSTAGGTADSGNYSASIQITIGTAGNSTDEEGLYQILIFDPAASTDTYFNGTVGYSNNVGNARTGTLSGHHGTAEAMDAIQFFFASGNIATGNFKLYRRANV